MVDTVRTISSLLTTLFQDGQPALSITPNDLRDLVVTMQAVAYKYPFVTNPEFGADPTGVADSTAAFNAAMAASKVVFVPPGSYRISNVVPPSGSSLVGFAGKGFDTGAAVAGAKLFALNAGTTNMINIDGKTDILLQGLILNGTGATTCNGISAGGVSCTIRDVTVRNCTGFGIGGAPAGGTGLPDNREFHIDKCDIFSCGTGIGDLIDAWVDGCSLTSNANNIVFTNGNSGEVNFDNTRIEWATTGYGFVSNVVFAAPNPGSKVKFSNCQFDRNWLGAANLNVCNYVQFNGCGLWRNGAGSTTTTSHVRINGCSHISFTGCSSNFGQDDGSTGNISPFVWCIFAGTNTDISFVGNDMSGYNRTLSNTNWFSGTAPTTRYILSKNFGTGTAAQDVDTR